MDKSRYKKTYSRLSNSQSKKTKLDSNDEKWIRTVFPDSDSDDDKAGNNKDDDDDELDEILRSPIKEKTSPISTPASTPASTPTPTPTPIATPQKSYVKEAYAVDSSSLRTLDIGRMLNDTIVHFYMDFLLTRAPVKKQEQIHLFNSFFFSKLKVLYQNKDRPKEATKQTVARWEKHAKIFERDFLVIPICDHQHWTLVIVAFARNVPPDTDEPFVVGETKQNGSSSTHNEAAILIFDSLGACRYLKRFTDPIREIFLNLRWKIERPNEDPRDFRDRGSMRDISAKVPKQKNSFDCGVYLLHSFERFLANPLLIYKRILRGDDLSSDFACDTLDKRRQIKLLIPTSGQ